VPAAEVSLFSRRATRAVGGLSLLSLLAAFYLLLFPGDGQGVRGVGPHGYSRSAIGHRGLIGLLREIGEPVLQLRMARDLSECGLLVLAEPNELDGRDDRRVASWLDQVPALLLVLPKRSGRADPAAPHWLDKVELLPQADVDDVLAHVGTWLDHRPPALVRTDVAQGWGSIWNGPAPTLVEPVQLLDAGDERIRPLVFCDQGVLLGGIGNFYVLSDPDLIANHGLPRGDNAALVVSLLRALCDRGAIVFDETLHGHEIEPSIWHAAGQFPLVLVPAHLLLLVSLTLWLAYGRFGAPLPVPAAIAAGKQFLIDNTAALLRSGGHHGPSLRRYARQRVRAIAEAMQAPRGLADGPCRDWLLARVRDPAQRRRLAELLARAATDVPARDALATARGIRTLTEEILHAGH